MSRPMRWIAAHPVAAFFLLTYMLSWPFLWIILRAAPGNMVVQGTLGSVAVYGPALAAMIAAAVTEPSRLAVRRGARALAFGVAWALAAAILVLFVWKVRRVPVEARIVGFGAVLALLPAFTVARAFSGIAGVQRHFRGLVCPRGNALWYLVAIAAFPAVQLLGVALARLLGTGDARLTLAMDPVAAALFFLHGFFFSGGINEESGWRGFALPRLQRKYPPLVAALVVWVFWAFWHFPVDLSSGAPVAVILENRVLLNAMWSILFMWVFNRTQGSVLAPALFHPAMNTSGSMLPRTDASTALFVLLTVFVIWKDRMWRTLPETHGGRMDGRLMDDPRGF